MKTKINWNAISGWVYVACFWLVMLIMALMLFSCSTIRREEFYNEQHRTSESLNRMDSLMQSHWQVQQDSTWHETVIKQLQSIRERNDTSRVVVVDSTGKVIKETVTIIRERERDNSQETYEREVMMHRLEVMDSTLRASNEQIARMDSLLQESKEQTIKEVPAKLSWWQQTRIHLANILLWALAIWLFVKFGWPLVKKYIKPL